jgi:lauroyl/myristoyl acyltransferase
VYFARMSRGAAANLTPPISAKEGMKLNEKLARIRLSFLLYRIPGIRWLGKRIPPAIYFKWVGWLAAVAYYTYPPDRRRRRYMRQAIESRFPGSELPGIIKSNIRHRKWRRALFNGYAYWANEDRGLIRIDGEEHLARTLSLGKGAVLLSAHAHGYTTMVAPVLSKKGYKYNRVVRRLKRDPEKTWRQGARQENLSYIVLGHDIWDQMRALQRMRAAVKNNQILHLPIRGFPRGDPEFEIDFYYKRFFLDAAAFQILEGLQAPVLPCFTFCDDRGRLVIVIHPASKPSTAEVMRVFGPLCSKYLREKPELAYFWRRMVRQQEGW